MDDKKYGIAETFDSLQGEGQFTGTRMFFIRFAGCSVGKPMKESATYEQCTTYDGRHFVCDTDYKVKERLTAAELIERIPTEVEHVCITGGEPFNQLTKEIMTLLMTSEYCVHIETSGTVKPDWWDYNYVVHGVWVTCSPKFGALDFWLKNADEIKLLVDESFDLAKVPSQVDFHENVYLTPVNNVDTLRPDNADLAMHVIMTAKPDWKLTMQAHKVWRIR